MKRYSCNYLLQTPMYLDPSGEWVQWDDVEKFINILKVAFATKETLDIMTQALIDQKDILELLKLYSELKRVK